MIRNAFAFLQSPQVQVVIIRRNRISLWASAAEYGDCHAAPSFCIEEVVQHNPANHWNRSSGIALCGSSSVAQKTLSIEQRRMQQGGEQNFGVVAVGGAGKEDEIVVGGEMQSEFLWVSCHILYTTNHHSPVTLRKWTERIRSFLNVGKTISLECEQSKRNSVDESLFCALSLE